MFGVLLCPKTKNLSLQYYTQRKPKKARFLIYAKEKINNKPLILTHDQKENYSESYFQLGKELSGVIEKVKYGVLVIFPSFVKMETCYKKWKEVSLAKTIFKQV